MGSLILWLASSVLVMSLWSLGHASLGLRFDADAGQVGGLPGEEELSRAQGHVDGVVGVVEAGPALARGHPDDGELEVLDADGLAQRVLAALGRVAEEVGGGGGPEHDHPVMVLLVLVGEEGPLAHLDVVHLGVRRRRCL